MFSSYYVVLNVTFVLDTEGDTHKFSVQRQSRTVSLNRLQC